MIEKIDIQKLNELPIEQVAQALGMNVNRHKALCPFHNDKHPSLTFSVSKNRYKCFVCDAHGGPIDLVMNYLHKTFLEACHWLSSMDPSTLNSQPSSNLPQPSTLNPQPSKRFDASRYARYFERPYLNDAAHKFLFEERKLDPRVIRWCRITSWQDRHGHNWLQTPYYDIDGNLVGIQFRHLVSSSKFHVSGGEPDLKPETGASPMKSASKREESQACLSSPEREQTRPEVKPETQSVPRFRFPKGAKCSIYNLPVLKLLTPGEPLYIAEGCSDCWSLLSSGHKAIAIPSATTLHQNELKKVLETWNVKLGTPLHIYPDQDIPGEKLYLQLTLLATQAGLCLIRHSLPAGCKDYSDFYLQYLKPETLNLKPAAPLR